MEELLKKFSPPLSSEKVGDILEDRKYFPTFPQKIFDLHGYFKNEVQEKMDFIFEFSGEKNLSYIKIITGKGKQILFYEVKKILIKKDFIYSSKREKFSFFCDEGSFDIFL